MYDDQANNLTSNKDQGSPVLGADNGTSGAGLGGFSAPSPVQNPTEPSTLTAPTTPVSSVVTPTTTSGDDLVTIKKKALDELSPLVGKLDQSPEEKYKTLMMMIQASDNQALIHEAYQAAQNITDEKARAEALLNIVNEINYFTQKST